MTPPDRRPEGALPDLLASRLAEDPGGRALIVHGGDTLDYQGWDERSRAVAGGLSRSGVTAGDRVALVFDNARWTDYAVAYLAVLRAGAVAVPLGSRFTKVELEGILDHCDARAVICPSDLVATVPTGPWRVAPVAEVEAAGAAAPPEKSDGGLRRPEDLAEILYTSGTTGTPKGVALSTANLVFHELPAGVGGDAVPARICFLHAFPVGSNAGQEVLRLPLRRTGRTAVVLPSFDPEALCAAVAEHRVTRLQLVPAMAQVLLDSGSHLRFDLSSIERITLSSAPVPSPLLARLAEAFPSATLCNAYALTESGTARTLLEGAETRPGSVGRPVGKAEVRIVDADDIELPAGQTGEIWLRRPGAPRREYYLDPAATAAAFAGDWLRTGDLGHLDEGYLYLDGRKKELIISGGLNVSPAEVENVLHEHPAVVDAAVVGLAHEVLGQEVAAVVVLGAPATVRDLQAFARARLAEYKVPHRLAVVDELPRNASGKVLKRDLPGVFDRTNGGESGGAAPIPTAAMPDSPLERSVLAVWQEVLGREAIGIDDDFFEIGGHSLAAAQVAARLQDEFAVELPVTAVFESPTVAELAALVAPLVESHPRTGP